MFTAKAQSPVNGFMQGQGNSATALSYSYERYSDVFLVPNKIDAVPVFDEVQLNSVSFYTAYGITDNFDVSVNLPYISATGNAPSGVLTELNYKNVRKGFQDVSLYLKLRPLSKPVGDGKLDFLVSAGLQTPLSSYKADEGLQSILAIGNRATQFNGFGTAHYKAANGFFVTSQIGYSLRSGRVPNALLGELKAGIALSKFYADAWVAGQTSSEGTNILGEGFDGFFPATDVSYHRVGINAFVPLTEGFGISMGANKIVSGRNIGAATGITGAIVYQIR